VKKKESRVIKQVTWDFCHYKVTAKLNRKRILVIILYSIKQQENKLKISQKSKKNK
jgi:hypothetical protein